MTVSLRSKGFIETLNLNVMIFCIFSKCTSLFSIFVLSDHALLMPSHFVLNDVSCIVSARAFKRQDFLFYKNQK